MRNRNEIEHEIVEHLRSIFNCYRELDSVEEPKDVLTKSSKKNKVDEKPAPIPSLKNVKISVEENKSDNLRATTSRAVLRELIFKRIDNLNCSGNIEKEDKEIYFIGKNLSSGKRVFTLKRSENGFFMVIDKSVILDKNDIFVSNSSGEPTFEFTDKTDGGVAVTIMSLLTKAFPKKYTSILDSVKTEEKIEEPEDLSETEAGKLAKSSLKSAYLKLREQLLLLSGAEVNPKKMYIGFEINGKHFIDIDIQKSCLKTWLNIEESSLKDKKKLCKNVKGTSHFGVGNFEVILKSESEINELITLATQAYEFQKNIRKEG